MEALNTVTRVTASTMTVENPLNAVASPDLAALKQRQQTTWASGDYAVIGTTLQIIGELLCEAADLHAGWKVLDVAAGNGNASLAAARRGCVVTSTDYVPGLLDRGRRRAEADGYSIAFQVADAENLPFEDEIFDAVLSTAGVMFTPDQSRAATELFRVCRPGGVVALANWTPDGFVGQIFKAIGRHLPPPAGVRSPSFWGTESGIQQLFPDAHEVLYTKRTFKFRALSAQHWLDEFRTFYGPMLKAFSAMEENGRSSLETALLALCADLNESKDGTLVVPSEYLEVIVRKRG
jgi:ubiquinone/menaquinone biosynthesis C-methylase UbiE